jgi:Flp pilus assembly protein TadG
MLKLARQIAGDERGSAVVDFAFLLPILMMLFVGVVEVTNVLRLDRKVVAAAQTTADLVTQRREVSNAQLDDFLRAAELIFEPYAASAITVGIAAVRYDADSGDPEVDWTKNKNGGSVPDALTMAAGLGQPGEGVVVVRVTYDYTPVFFDFVLNPMEIEETAILRPRRSRFVQGPTS